MRARVIFIVKKLTADYADDTDKISITPSTHPVNPRNPRLRLRQRSRITFFAAG
jgi:hypothetical protein